MAALYLLATVGRVSGTAPGTECPQWPDRRSDAHIDLAAGQRSAVGGGGGTAACKISGTRREIIPAMHCLAKLVHGIDQGHYQQQ